MNEDRVFAKCAWRLLPLLLTAYITNYIDRANIGFAALTMNKELGLSPSIYGLGAGVFFLSYGLFQVPSNIALHRVGAKRWICLIIALWGFASAATAFIRGPNSFYLMRILLGMAEAGLVPGVVLYLTYWFPRAWIGRSTAVFMTATIVAPVIGGPIASIILRLDGVLGIHGWRWLFLLEALPPLMIAATVIYLLPDGPAQASWLTPDEKWLITQRIRREDSRKEQSLSRALRDPRILLLGIGYGLYLSAGYGLAFWVPLVVQQAGFSNFATGFVTALIFIAAMPGMIIWSYLSDRKGERIWFAALPALLLSAAFAIATVTSNNLVLLLALAFAAVGSGSILAPYYGIPPLFLTGPAMAGGFALMNAIGNLLGGFGGQYGIGLLRQVTGNYTAAFTALSAATLLTAVIVLAVGRTIRPHAAIVPAPAGA